MALRDAFYNPTDEQRQNMLYQSLELSERAEDYDNIVQLLSPPPDILNFAAPMSMRGLNICILGGGLSGLTAAYELRKLGGNITVLDAESSRVGGRVYTHYFNNSVKYFGELGAMRIPVSHETSWYYINLFGLNTESLSSPRSNNFMYVNNIRMRRDYTGRNIEENLYPLYNLSEWERNTPWDELDYYASNTMFNSLNTQQRSEILKILPAYSPEYASITKLSNRQVYEDLGLSQGFVNLLSAVDPFAASLLYVSHDETMSSIYTQDFFNVYRISGGMVKLPLAFISSFADSNPSLGNVAIKFGCILSGIYQS
ncbi:MAG TPA: amine oxidase, partial [Clostridiales bacterium]|nr:amine oxidase [Clostridiales bacterium]